MKTVLRYSTLCLAFCALLFVSCSNEPLEEVQDQKVFEAFNSKSKLLSLSPEEQKQAWIARLDLYLGMDLSQPQKNLIRKMQADIMELEKGKFFPSENFRQDILAMARITPELDFLNLFVEVTPYLPVLTKFGTPCTACVEELENYVALQEEAGAITSRAQDCDCWATCQQQEDNMLCPPGQSATTLSPCSSDQEEGCCNKTASGCGPFELFSCSGLVVCETY